LDERVYRVVAHFGRDYNILVNLAERPAVPCGNLRRSAQHDPLAAPAVGDWVACTCPEGDGPAIIRRVLDRRSAFVRKAAVTRTAIQVSGPTSTSPSWSPEPTATSTSGASSAT